MSELFSDPTRMCPECGQSDALRFRALPASELHYEEDGENYTQHLGPSRDYECRDCGATFIMEVE